MLLSPSVMVCVRMCTDADAPMKQATAAGSSLKLGASNAGAAVNNLAAVAMTSPSRKAEPSSTAQAAAPEVHDKAALNAMHKQDSSSSPQDETPLKGTAESHHSLLLNPIEL